MEEKKTTVSGGLGFSGALTIVFIVLKLLGKITWKWIWVLSPLWISWSIALILAVILIVIKVIVDR